MNIYEIAAHYEELNVAEIDLDDLNEAEIEKLHYLVSKKEEFKRFNKLAYYKPYPFQSEWIQASNHYRQRYLSAANRIGKTYGACMELAYHITGLYPEWWNGRKLEDTGKYWAIGVSQESVNSVLMKELLGVTDCRHLSELGTGSIPKDCIDLFSMQKDGARCIQVRIKHVSGKWNTLHFFSSTQDETVFMGADVLYILMDEQFKTEETIYAQCLARTATTGGMISVTCTPEQGRTPLWDKFHNNEEGKLYFQVATWDDAPHLTPEIKEEIKAGFPAYQLKMRCEGIPVIGNGAVYPFNEDEIKGNVTVEEIASNPAEWLVLWSCDFGKSDADGADPSTLVLLAHNTRTDVTYVIDEWNSKQDSKHDRLSYMPEYMATVIKSHYFSSAPLIVPHDGNNHIEGKANTTRISEFVRCGVNVLRRVFEIPLRYTMGAVDKPKHSRDLIYTIQLVNKMFRDEKLKIDLDKCKNLYREYQVYQWGKNGLPNDSYNHHLDAMRYGVISIRDKGQHAYKCTGAGRKATKGHEYVNKMFADSKFI